MDQSSNWLHENSCFHRKTETFGNMKTLNMRLRQYMVYFYFSSHLQVINTLYEQYSANDIALFYKIYKYSALLCDKKSVCNI